MSIPVMIEAHDALAKQIPVLVNKSERNARWRSISKKVEEFDKHYPEISEGDLYVNRLRNQLVTYTPYSYLNGKKSASARIPLKYNSCETLELTYDVLSSGVIREYADHIDFYLNNFRNDTTVVRKDVIRLEGMNTKPSYEVKKHASYKAEVKEDYNEAEKSYSLQVKHLGPVDLTLSCQGDADRSAMTDAIPSDFSLSVPKQPEAFNGTVIIEAEDMDYRNVAKHALTNPGWCSPDYSEFSGMGYVEMGSDKRASLRHNLNLKEAGEYDIYIRYCNASKDGEIEVSVNGDVRKMTLSKTAKNDWKKLKVEASLVSGENTFIITSTSGAGPTVDQIIYMPKGTPEEKFLVTVREAEGGKVISDVAEASEGQKVTLTVEPQPGYALKELRVVSSVYYTMSKTIDINDSGEITFTMPDENVTILPIFYDTTSAYKLDFTYVSNGAIPEGWRCIQENNEVHEYPNTFGLGARTMKDFTGFQGKALYWRDNCAEYGTQEDYRLNLEPGEYKLIFAMAAWKGSPKYNVVIRNADTDTEVATSGEYATIVNANGNTSADLTAEEEHEFTFTIPAKGNYIIKFADKSTYGGYHEFLLLECLLNCTATTGVDEITEGCGALPAGIYSPQGLKISSMQPGLNIVIDANGKARKVMH